MTIDPRPPLVLRILRFPLVLLVLGMILGLILVQCGNALTSVPPFERSWLILPGEIVLAAIGLLIYAAFRRWVEGERPDDVVLLTAPRQLPLGFFLGVAIFTAVALVSMVFGVLKVGGINGVGALWSAAAMSVSSGVMEEILFRGIIQREIEKMTGSWIALAITSALFGLAHLANPNATWFGAVAIAVEAGVLLGGAYLMVRSLWLPIGLHAGWNFAQAWVFSAPTSGIAMDPGLLITRLTGTEWLSGGAFGLEASIQAIVFATGAGIVLLLRASRQGSIRRAPWNRRSDEAVGVDVDSDPHA